MIHRSRLQRLQNAVTLANPVAESLLLKHFSGNLHNAILDATSIPHHGHSTT